MDDSLHHSCAPLEDLEGSELRSLGLSLGLGIGGLGELWCPTLVTESGRIPHQKYLEKCSSSCKNGSMNFGFINGIALSIDI